MNAMTRVYNSGAVRASAAHKQKAAWGKSTSWLILGLILSAFAVVYLKDLNRRTFIAYQDMVHANQQAQIDWGKLLLEQSTCVAQANIQQIAVQRLQMYNPSAKEIVLLKSSLYAATNLAQK